MRYLLDTDVCVRLIRHRSSEILERLARVDVRDVAVSSVTVAELCFGAEKSTQPERNRQALAAFLSPLTIADFGYSAAVAYGLVRTELERSGRAIGPLDTLIAAHALSLDLTLVTSNTKEFSRVAGLKLEDWVS